MGMAERTNGARKVPAWVPSDVRNYVFHTEMGQPIRALARSQACHASTIMRQIRKVESRRDDPLVDRAIKALAVSDGKVETPSRLELLQALRRLSAPDAILAIALGMEQGVIIEDSMSGEADHGTKLPCQVAMTLALKGWIATRSPEGRVLRYRITPAGRVALRDLMAASENHARSMAEAPAAFEGAKPAQAWDEGQVVTRLPVQESPVMGLARRKDRDGAPFLTKSMVRAAERLREDFEIAQIGQGRNTADAPPNWADVLKRIEARAPLPEGGNEARVQVNRALEFLGPGLAEVALRCCCLLEGLEVTEKHMGWAARSGKVVLRIALQRLVLHYEGTGDLGPRIG